MTEHNPESNPDREPMVPPPDAGAGDARHDDTREPSDSTSSRRSFVAAFSALGLSGFRLLFAGAAATPARAEQTYPCAAELPNGDTAPDLLCGTTSGLGVHNDLDCANVSTSTPEGYMHDDDCNRRHPGGAGVWRDDACGLANVHTGVGAQDLECDRPDPGGGSHADSDCNTFAGPTGNATNNDNDCESSAVGGSDADCGSPSEFGVAHSDQDCASTVFQSDQDCGLSGWPDSDCGSGSGAPSPDG